jgi:hypothetical protein
MERDLTSTNWYKGKFDITQYKKSYADKQRLKDIEMVPNEEGGVDIVDHSVEKWQPTERQQQFLDVLFDPDSDGYLDMQLAVKQDASLVQYIGPVYGVFQGTGQRACRAGIDGRRAIGGRHCRGQAEA